MRIFVASFASTIWAFGASADPATAGAKCVEAMKAMDVDNAEEGCACFIASLSDEELAEYEAIDLAKWEIEASDALKEAGEVCFPAEE